MNGLRHQGLRLTLAATTMVSLLACQTNSGVPKYTQSQRQKAATANLNLGVGYLQQGNLALAKTKLERAEAEDSHNADIHAALGVVDVAPGSRHAQ